MAKHCAESWQKSESDLKVSESKLEEMASARNEAAASERRVRRGLYRLASGRMTMEDVLKAVEKEDNGVSFMETLAMIDGMISNNKAATSSSPDGATSTAVVSSDAMSSPAHSAAVGGSKGSPAANGEEVAQLKKNLQDVQVIAETRDKKIAEVSSVCIGVSMTYHFQPQEFTHYILLISSSTASYRKRRSAKTYKFLTSSQR